MASLSGFLDERNRFVGENIHDLFEIEAGSFGTPANDRNVVFRARYKFCRPLGKAIALDVGVREHIERAGNHIAVVESVGQGTIANRFAVIDAIDSLDLLVLSVAGNGISL